PVQSADKGQPGGANGGANRSVIDVMPEGLEVVVHVAREPPQILERGIARSEIIDRDPNPHRAQLLERLDRWRGAVQDHILGKLEIQEARFEARMLERFEDPFHQVRLFELAGRESYPPPPGPPTRPP